MNPLGLRFAMLCAAWLAALGIGFAAAWQWQGNRYDAVIARHEAARQADLTALGNAAAAQMRQTLARQQERERQRDQLDQQALARKEQLNAQNQSLRRAVADGTRRLHIAGQCVAGDGRLSAAAATAGLDPAGTVELTAVAGQRVLDLRAAIIADQAALSALQQYVRQVCLK